MWGRGNIAHTRGLHNAAAKGEVLPRPVAVTTVLSLLEQQNMSGACFSAAQSDPPGLASPTCKAKT